MNKYIKNNIIYYYMEHDVKIKTKRKTLATYSNLDKYETRVLDYLTSESKSTYNSYIYCSKIF